jgi:hypothetical protein
MSSEGPIRFYAVSHGRHDDYCEFFILATSPEDALRRYLRSDYPYYNVVGTAWEADFDPNGLLQKTKELFEVELVGKNGYLWERMKGEEDIDAKYGIVRCLLCGMHAPGDPPTEEDKKKFLNADRKCEDCAKYKIFKP